MQLTIHAELIEQPHTGNPDASYVSRVLLKDDQDYNRAVLAIGDGCPDEATAHDSAIRAYERKANPR